MNRKDSKTAEQRKAEREALLATLNDKVAALANSDDWAAYLRIVAALRRYSTGRKGIFEVRECVS
jgi:hypothetical protein